MSFYAYVQQPDDDAPIWHYLDFARFMLLLEQRALFFPQVTRLNNDLEGRGSIGTVAPGSNVHNSTNDAAAFAIPPRACLVVNCWHIQPAASAALWRHYQSTDTYLAIQSTVRALKTSLNFSTLRYVKIGEVNYRMPTLRNDETGVSIEVDYFYKQDSFAYEGEMRILAHVRDLENATHLGGALVPADLNTLIQGIQVAPQAPSWYGALIQSLVTERYSLDTQIEVPEQHVRILV